MISNITPQPCLPAPKDFFGFDIYTGDTVAAIWDVYLKECTVINVYPEHNRINLEFTDLGGARSDFTCQASAVVKKIMDPEDLKLVKFTLGANQ